MISIEHLLIYVIFLLYLASMVFYWAARQTPAWMRYASWLAMFGLLCNFLALAYHVAYSHRLPLTNGYEFMMSFVFITVLSHLLYEKRSRHAAAGAAVMLINVLLMVSIMVLMPQQIGQAGPLMPALKSPWLISHVLTAIAAYSAFALVSGLALVKLQANNPADDHDIYRITSLGFVMLTLSIVLGAIWAEQVWGSYWTWDPKETWALITWIIYAIYLHLHRQRGWRGNKARILLIAGFVLVLFTFFGVNYLLPGLHSYA
ncbi:MAG TPA: cytochrome c biogenesis protein CcsA [Syntrophomonas sp.]|nr:cytochrome c biogenesis protein CcsA [Syntrophomonas sp.]HRW12301.1 cytochrome c biogenesis protein CcsA [Syntrophomonas sp.]